MCARRTNQLVVGARRELFLVVTKTDGDLLAVTSSSLVALEIIHKKHDPDPYTIIHLNGGQTFECTDTPEMMMNTMRQGGWVL